MTFMAITMGLGPLFYILLGFRYIIKSELLQTHKSERCRRVLAKLAKSSLPLTKGCEGFRVRGLPGVGVQGLGLGV